MVEVDADWLFRKLSPDNTVERGSVDWTRSLPIGTSGGYSRVDRVGNQAGQHRQRRQPKSARVVTIWSQSRFDGFRDRCKLLTAKRGEMSEWLKEHAWKSIPLARADTYQIPPTQFRSTTSRNIDVR
jgi:hypothetical protein